MKFQERSKKKVDFLHNLIGVYNKVDCIEKFTKEFGCHKSTAYDWYHIVNTKTRSGHQLNSKKYKYNKLTDCYFCHKEAKHRHHLNYEEDITIPLCNSCHRKIHFITNKQRN